ncbi:hypothetical protein IHQ71_12225 [Rhizobium sp. TH2]|uniref:hypothetical protein n=1 Tax=Rhizobium sp. TH2 TaxID=2775403 RepID=UPI002157156D|nr:hypothetical protein [Rhizobium sp. TH2]UVC11268.1 hypothetical protein IHQ71_12225 [Rhizobium sp. TH2]
MLHIETYWKAHPHVIDETGTACAIEDIALGAAHVMVPEEVDIPLPRDTAEQIAVPASINGRDLSRGKP